MAVTLTHLNSLFEKIADRHSRGINSVKLYKLILKTDINKHKIEWYRCKLGIDDCMDLNVNENSEENKSQRIVARGPFIAMFKHEKIAFVNSLDTAARSLCTSQNKKKRKSKSKNKRRKSHGNSNNSISSNGSHSTLTNDWTIKNSVKTEPVQPTNDHQHTNENLKVDGRCDPSESKSQSRSPKRKKIEDKMGMIIVAEIDHDEISAVSVSPTSENSDCGGGNLRSTIVEDKNLMARECSRARNSGSLRLRKERKSSSRKSSRKERRSNRKAKGGSGRSDKLRSIRSIGDDANQDSEDVCDDGYTSSCTTATSSSLSLSTRNRRRTQSMTSLDQHDDANSFYAESVGEKLHKHERNPSNEEPTVDIREVMEDSSNYLGKFHGSQHQYSQNYHFGNMYPYMYQMPSGCMLGDRNSMSNVPDLSLGMNQTLSYQDMDMLHKGHHHQMVYPNNYMNHHPLQQNPYHPVNHPYHYNTNWYPQNCYDSSNSGNARGARSLDGKIVYEECSFFKGLASIVKKMFGIEKNRDLLDHSSPMNGEDNHQQTTWLSGNHFSNHQCKNYTNRPSEHVQNQPQMPPAEPTPLQTHSHSRERAAPVPNTNRPRSRSRIYSDDEDFMRGCNSSNSQYPHESFSTSSSDQRSLYTSEYSSLHSTSTDLSPTTLSCSTSSFVTNKMHDERENDHNNSQLKDNHDRIERVLSFQLQNDEDGQSPKYNRRRLYSCPEKTTGKGMKQKMKPLPSLASEKCDDKPILTRRSSSSRGENSSHANKHSNNSRSGRSSSTSKTLKERSNNNCQSQDNRGSDGRKSKKVNLLSSSSKPSSIVGLSRSKTDGIRMLSSSMAKPSLSRLPLSRSSSLGSSTSSRNVGESRRGYNTLLSLR